jgi:nucleoside-diphosphate kinase
MEKTVVLVKPDGLQRGLIGEIVSRFERKGLKLKGIKMVRMTRDLLEQWYEQYKNEDFFDDIAEYMSWTPIVAMVWEGYSAIGVVRRIVGTRKGYEAEAGSIRGDLGMSGGNNLIHASDAPKTAKREMEILFNKDEVFEYKTVTEDLIYSADERKGVFR